MRHSWVYILRCSDGTYYVGSTTNLQQRVAQHHYGTFAGYTSSRRPVELKWSQEFGCITDAIEAERRIKKWTRAKKEALIAGDFELLHELARSSKTKSSLRLPRESKGPGVTLSESARSWRTSRRVT